MTNVVKSSLRLAADYFPVLYPVFGGRHHFIIDLGEEGPYHWQFGSEEPFFGKIGRKLDVGGVITSKKLSWLLAGLSSYGPSSNWRAGHLDHGFLYKWKSMSRSSYFIWCGLLEYCAYLFGFLHYYLAYYLCHNSKQVPNLLTKFRSQDAFAQDEF